MGQAEINELFSLLITSTAIAIPLTAITLVISSMILGRKDKNENKANR